MGNLYNLILSSHYYIGIFLIFITLIGIYYISKKFYINFINKFVISIIISGMVLLIGNNTHNTNKNLTSKVYLTESGFTKKINNQNVIMT